MSLVSASSITGGIKEYTYKGIQQLPLIITATSFIFTITTGSISHLNLTLGLGILMPLYASICQLLVGFLPSYITTTRSTSDVCRLVQPGFSENRPLTFYTKGANDKELVPSFWLMNIAFFIGYIISNAVDVLQTPAESDANADNVEKRTYQGIYLVTSTVIFSAILLFIRFRYMSGCEGRGGWGYILSMFFALGAASIGYGMYTFSRVCGARTSDLFGILSQILPTSATSPSPIVCSDDTANGIPLNGTLAR